MRLVELLADVPIRFEKVRWLWRVVEKWDEMTFRQLRMLKVNGLNL
jgi:hypothetical protein